MIRVCPACGNRTRCKFRIVLLQSRGGATNRKVCQSCADQGVTIVAPRIVSAVDSGAVSAVMRDEILSQLIASIQSRIPVSRASETAGLERAIQILKECQS